MTMTAKPDQIPANVRTVMRLAALFRRWLVVWLVIFTGFNALPLLAPVLMHSGATTAGNAIYDLYGIISHQMAHRSYFFFGEQLSYAPEAFPVSLVGDYATDAAALRAFRGNAEVGWKVAWSDRLLAMFGAGLVTTWLYALIWRKRETAGLPLWLAALLIAPLVIDGATHYVSDFDGVREGFRYSNAWLVALTGNAFSDSFYVGAQVGSFNAWMRLLTGIAFGIGFMGYALPRVEQYFDRNARTLEQKLADWRSRQSRPHPVEESGS